MKKILKKSFIDTIPVLTGYLVLGFGFGIVLKSSGYSIFLAIAMSIFIYAGSMQYVAVGLFTGGASIITTLFTTLMVNARHLFYGVSMLNKYKNTGKKKFYLMFSLTDETYSLLCNEKKELNEKDKNNYYFYVSLFNQCYWVFGTLLGALIGSIIDFNSEGIEFALTALFVTVFIDQWMNSKDHFPAVLGLISSIICLLIFKANNFLIPTMIVIALILMLKIYTQKFTNSNIDTGDKDGRK